MKEIKLNIKQSIRHNSHVLLLGAFCIALLLVRAKLTHSIFYFFLIWNLFLAFTPLAITSYLMERPYLIEKKWLFLPILCAWLLLLPNSPYIITDFMHLKRETSVPVWFDVLLLISFSMAGLLFGLKSMKHIFYILAIRFNYIIVWLALFCVCILSGFGIYVGRYLRYNSWDILHRPLELIGEITNSLTTHPECITAWGVTFGFGTFLFLLFLMHPDIED